ncbi:hypothetical protein QR680_003651 [Steinernema hermaphroditum]|uniref:Uncharacterized protein n=1 Tax=Steinernema hermaphroditum TaxID=289476 RepID=A0AA39LRW7_9BILA|nr:hypothetical protein QR680_003651 [Steinernema hermaphroditum]
MLVHIRLLLLPIVASSLVDRSGYPNEGGPKDALKTIAKKIDHVQRSETFQNYMERIKNVSDFVNQIIPVDEVRKVSGWVSKFAGKQMMDYETDELKRIQKELHEGFVSLERSIQNAVDTLRCDQAFSTYQILHHEPAVRAEEHIENILTVGPNAAMDFEKACRLRDYVTDLKSLMDTLSRNSYFGFACLADKKYTYTALIEIKRIIKVDAFLLALNAIDCHHFENDRYELHLNESLQGLQGVFEKLDEAQHTNALGGINETLFKLLYDRTFKSAEEIANELGAKLVDYNSTRASYMVNVIPRHSDKTLENKVSGSPGYEKRLITYEEKLKYTVAVYAADLTNPETEQSRTFLENRKQTVVNSLRNLDKAKCPDAQSLAERLKTIRSKPFAYVRIVTTQGKTDFLYKGDARVGYYDHFKHSDNCYVHYVIGY